MKLQAVDVSDPDNCNLPPQPARVVVGGLPTIPGSTMYKKRNYFMSNLDNLRKILIQEPRGYPCQNVNFIVPPTDEEAKFGYVIGEQACVYPLMSGHNTICVATVLLETGMVEMVEGKNDFKLEAPGGVVDITAFCEGGKAKSIKILNFASFVHFLDVDVDVPHLGRVVASVAYGGMHYAVVDVDNEVNKKTLGGLRIQPHNGRALCRYGEMIKVACREQYPVTHPTLDYPGCDILAFVSDHPTRADADGLNTVVMSNGALDWAKEETWTGMLDRSPCGSGTSAVMAVRHRRGLLKVGEGFVHEGIVGTIFKGVVEGEEDVGGVKGIRPSIEGRGWVTQICQVVLNPNDPFLEGYTVGDIW